MQRRTALLSLAVGAVALHAPPLLAQDDKAPLRLMVGLAPGGTNDIVARLLAEKLRTLLGRTVLVENKIGAGQRLALSEVRRAPPDGRLLFVGTLSPFTIYPNIYRKLDYDPVNDFTPIARSIIFEGGVAAGPMSGATDIRQLVAWLKANPTKASYGSPGNGSQPHFLGAAMGQSIGVNISHVPYKGGALALTDLVGGQIPMVINSLPDLMEMHRAGKIHIVAVTGDKRSPLLPNVPTLIESGINVQGVNTLAIYGPPKMPPALVKHLNEAIVAATLSPDVKEKLTGYGLIPATTTPQELAQAQAAELNRLAPIIKATGYMED